MGLFLERASTTYSPFKLETGSGSTPTSLHHLNQSLSPIYMSSPINEPFVFLIKQPLKNLNSLIIKYEDFFFKNNLGNYAWET